MNTYGVFFRLEGPEQWPGSIGRSLAMWTLLPRKRDAFRLARKAHGVVGVMRNQRYADVWDAPTFRVCMEVMRDHSGPISADGRRE